MSYRGSLADVVGSVGIPYGYTLTIWSTGALCIGRFGLPHPGEVFLFAAGGTVAYALLACLVRRWGTVASGRDRAPLGENAVAFPVLVAVFGFDRLVEARWLSFVLSSFVATLGYLLGLAVLVAWLGARRRRGSPGSPPGPAPWEQPDLFSAVTGERRDAHSRTHASGVSQDWSAPQRDHR